MRLDPFFFFLKVKDAIGVARAVMDYTDHTLIVGNWVNVFYTNH